MMRRRLLLNHLVFWTLFVSVSVVFDTIARNQGAFSLQLYLRQFTDLFSIVKQGRVLFTFYLSLWVLTRFFYPRQLGVIFLQILLLGVFDSVLGYMLEQKIIGPLTGQWFSPPGTPILGFTLRDLTTSCLYVLLAFLFKHLRDHFRTEALQHEKNAIELAYLKSQLNPHFLFNTLNNLYGLALTEPERTPDVVLKLSELMRYVLYESNETYVSLPQEIEYLSSYISLEKLRHEGPVYVDFTVVGPVDGQRIAPLLLISFVENAFKHGAVTNADCPITLHLSVVGSQLTFMTRNQIVRKNKDQVGGIGLASVRRRLALLYPGQHRLAVSQEHDVFECALQLDTHVLQPVS
ncbi:sensor histidine kinase [Hymenobacter tibetensis]|uniref:Sensor histidine kinase n=1 Tax=Hymenobacter tibetensis TaxID=497967 RepID=A0ABY4CWA6_9BACT|nr:sensor histidine kinase [Hymenobacter tibetensis]UOG73274.1 sensor histidine kinase [Hymenobacter tibetensis]